MRTRTIVLAAFVLVVVAAGAGAYALRRHPESASAASDARATVEVRQGTLRKTETLTGRLEYGGSRTVTGTGDGLITWLPSVGTTVSRGGQLFRVDDAPVTLFYGDMPFYRTLEAPAPGKGGGKGKKQPPDPPQTGHDVDLVAQNLAALGFWHGGVTDQSYSGYLVSAVKAWQTSLGEEPTGVITLGAVVTAPASVRVLSVLADEGTPAAQDVLTVTGTRRSSTLRAPQSLARSLAPGVRVRIRMGDGTAIAGRIVRIGTATSTSNGAPTLPVDVRAARPRKLRTAPFGTVSAKVVTAKRKDVLHVGINALLALSGGGYALERPDRSLVPVEIGMIANGQVEVSGIEAGARVVVAR